MLVEAVVVGVFVVFILALMVWAARWSKKHGELVDRTWAEVAERLGGSFFPVTGPWHRKEPRRIEATVAGSDVLVDHYTVSRGKSSTTYTRIQVPAWHSGDMKLEIYRRHALSGVGDLLGFQDVSTGDHAFDQRYQVKASDEERARSWLDGDLLSALVALEEYRFVLEDGAVEVSRVALEFDGGKLERAIRAAVLLATGGERIVACWRRLAGSLGGSLAKGGRGWPLWEVEEGAVPVKLDVVELPLAGASTHTRVRARIMSAASESFALGTDGRLGRPAAASEPVAVEGLPSDYAAVSSAPEQTARRLGPELCQRIVALAPASVTADGEQVTMLWPGIEATEQGLRQAIAIAAELAAPPAKGPYR